MDQDVKSQIAQNRYYPAVYADQNFTPEEWKNKGRYSLNHFHWFKTADIINRGGGISGVPEYAAVLERME